MNDINYETSARGRTDNLKIISTVVLSLFMHLVVVLLVIVNDETSYKDDTSSTVAVESYLIFKKARLERSSIDVDEDPKVTPSGQVSADISQTMSKHEARFLNEKTIVPISQDIVEKNSNGRKGSESIEESRNLIKNDSTDAIKPTNSLIENRQKIPSILIQKPISATGLIINAVNSVNKDAYASMLQQETDTFNKLKNSPIIDTIRELNTTEVPTELSPTVVNCVEGISKTLAVISKFTGGNIQCKQYEIQSFIDKRLNKKPKRK
ncbi:MAG: hypothetical protein ACJAY1_000599 [Glaciecola sp.]